MTDNKGRKIQLDLSHGAGALSLARGGGSSSHHVNEKLVHCCRHRPHEPTFSPPPHPPPPPLPGRQRLFSQYRKQQRQNGSTVSSRQQRSHLLHLCSFSVRRARTLFLLLLLHALPLTDHISSFSSPASSVFSSPGDCGASRQGNGCLPIGLRRV